LVWRGIFAFGSFLALAGMILRYFATQNSANFVKAQKQAKGTRRKFAAAYWQPLLGTSLIWLLFDIVEYGLKQNDAAIFSADKDGPYKEVVLSIMLTRLLVIPSLVFAPWLLTKLASKHVQLIGFAGCIFANLVLAISFYELKSFSELLFDALYIIQLSFQSLPGVTTMAISAQIYPTAVRGTGAGISAASGKVGATIGSYFFTMLKEYDLINEIFWVVTGTALVSFFLTMVLTPLYNGATLDAAEELAEKGKMNEAKQTLFAGPLDETDGGEDESKDDEEAQSDPEREAQSKRAQAV